jgi:hypothetical protein
MPQALLSRIPFREIKVNKNLKVNARIENKGALIDRTLGLST